MQQISFDNGNNFPADHTSSKTLKAAELRFGIIACGQLVQGESIVLPYMREIVHACGRNHPDIYRIRGLENKDYHSTIERATGLVAIHKPGLVLVAGGTVGPLSDRPPTEPVLTDPKIIDNIRSRIADLIAGLPSEVVSEIGKELFEGQS